MFPHRGAICFHWGILTAGFLTTHYMDEPEYCDRIAIIDNGTIVVEGTPDELKASVGKDRVTLRSDDHQAAIAALRDRFGLEATRDALAVELEAGQREHLIAYILSTLDRGALALRQGRPDLIDRATADLDRYLAELA